MRLFLAIVKKSTEKTTKKVAATAKKTVASKVAAATAMVKAAHKAEQKAAVKEKFVYMFFNCNEGKDVASMNVRYNCETFTDTAACRKALLKKVEAEVVAGYVNVSDAEAVKSDIQKGEPEQASSKLQCGDIERLVLVA